MAQEIIEWVRPVDGLPEPNRKCIVHAMNQWYVAAMLEPENQQFYDKDGQPVVGVIEWSYRPDRTE